MDIQERLFSMQDLGYRDFQAKLMPTVDQAKIIGVRTPQLRAFAKELAGSPEAEQFLETLPHTYYEEDNLHGELIVRMKDYDICIAALNRFLPWVDNWATCDKIRPKVFAKHRDELLGEIRRWLASDSTYTVRFGIGMLMVYYLDEAFLPEYLDMVSGVQSEEYYIKMMIAWYFATALAKQYEAALPFIEKQSLEIWTHNKAIQKSIESRRITPEQKAYLRGLKR